MGAHSALPQISKCADVALPVPFSSGTIGPRLTVPALAGDCHVHICDGCIPAMAGAALLPADAGGADCPRLQLRLGLTRAVVVTPAANGAANGPTRLRALAVVTPKRIGRVTRAAGIKLD